MQHINKKHSQTLMAAATAIVMISAGSMACHSAPSAEQANHNTATDTTVITGHDSMIWVTYKNAYGNPVRDEWYLQDTIYNELIPYSATQNSYNSIGMLDSQTYYMVDIMDLKLKPLELDIWIYDSAGRTNQAVQKVYRGDTGLWTNVKMQMYDYDDSLLKFESVYEWIEDQEQWKEVYARLYDYDSTGTLIQSLIHEADPYDTSKTIKRIEKE